MVLSLVGWRSAENKARTGAIPAFAWRDRAIDAKRPVGAPDPSFRPGVQYLSVRYIARLAKPGVVRSAPAAPRSDPRASAATERAR